MARAENYYEVRLKNQNTVQPTTQNSFNTTSGATTTAPEIVSPEQAQINKNLKLAKIKAEQEYYTIEANKPISRLFAESILFGKSSPEEVKQKALEKIQEDIRTGKTDPSKIQGSLNARLLAAEIDAVGNNLLNFAVRTVKALPSTLIKAPLKAHLSLLQGWDFVTGKLGLGTNFSDRYKLPVLGDVVGFKGTRQDAIDAGFSPFMAGVVATGEFAGDLAITATLGEAIMSAFKPRIITVDKPVIGEDIRPLTTVEKPKINVNVKSKDGKIVTGKEINPSLEAIQNSDVSYFQLPKSAAEKYGGNSNNTFLKVSPAGDGTAEFSVVQVRKSLVERTKDYFAKKHGASNVVEGKLGPEIKLDSGLVKYDSGLVPSDGALTKVKLPDSMVSDTASKKAYQFYSPKNTDEIITIDQAKQRLSSQQHIEKKAIAEDIDRQLGLQSKQYDAIGDTKDYGTENALFNEMSNVKNFDDVIYSSVLKGRNMDQKGVIPFITDESGKDMVYTIDIIGKTEQVLAKDLDSFGLDYRTYVGDDNKIKVVIYDEGSQLINKVNDFANKYDTDFKYEKGTGKFIGAETREEARTIYDNIISEYEKVPGNRRYEGKYRESLPDNRPSETQIAEPFKGDEFAKKIPEVPSLMSKPIKGFENKLVSGKQVNQIKALQEEREIDDVTLNAISKVITGRTNINELTQQEAYNLSQSIYNSPKAEIDSPVKDYGGFINRSHVEPARYWMEDVERNFGYPIYSDINVPMNYGMRLLEKDFAVYNAEAMKVFGKYANGKYAEEMRMIDEYSMGNKNAILKNETLSPETKADLVKIGDWMVERYKKLFKELGDLTGTNITSTKWFGNYAPNITNRGGLFNKYKNIDEVPAEIKPFYRFEREGSLSPLIDNPLAKYQMYMRSILKEKYIGKTVERAKELIEEMKQKGSIKISKYTNDYLQEKLGFQDELSKALNKLGENLANKTNSFLSKDIIPKDLTKQTIDFMMTNSYAGALGGRIMPIFRQLQGLLMDYADLGPEAFYNGLKNSFKKGAMKSARDEGFLVEMGLPYGNELIEKSNANIFNAYSNINKATLKPYGWVDNWTRTVAKEGAGFKFDTAINKFLQGKIDYNTFESESGIDGLNPTMRNILRKEITTNTAESLKKAKDLYTQDTLDNTLFPYRRGEGARVQYGLGGKVGLQFSQWVWEYQRTLRSWISRGQWMKLIRFVGTSVAMNRTAKEAFGIDTSTWSLLGPFTGFPFGPILKTVFDLTTAAGQALLGQSADLNKSAKDITRSMKLYGGILTGVETSKIQDFNRSINRYEAGISVSPDPEKPFGVYSTTGKLLYWTDFTGLLLKLMNFQSTEATNFSNRVGKANVESTKYDARINKAMNYLVNGKMEKFDKFVTDNNLMINDISAKLKSYNTPLDQRIFEKLPAELKMKYINLFYPQ